MINVPAEKNKSSGLKAFTASAMRVHPERKGAEPLPRLSGTSVGISFLDFYAKKKELKEVTRMEGRTEDVRGGA